MPRKPLSMPDTPPIEVAPLVVSAPPAAVTLVTGHMPVYRIELPEPRMGAKCYLIETKGVYILESGPGTLRSLACTHVGTGAITVHDGIPDERGFFEKKALLDPYSPDYLTANGRRLFKMTPQVMGFWALDAGFQNGLTIISDGGTSGIPVFISVAWIKFKGTPSGPKKVEMLKD